MAQPDIAVGLYQRALGSAWEALHPALRAAHAGHGVYRAAGSFEIRYGRGWLARAIVAMCGMPPAAASVPTRLVVAPGDDFERWFRTFGARPLDSVQTTPARGRVWERFGPVEIRFHLGIDGGALVYVQERCALALPGLHLPMPGWLAPRVAAREEPGSGPGATRIEVTISAPWGGLLITYQGEIAPEGGPA
ncbi:MAG: DUF4166 domain-containing protein [Chloroflexota bacterium]